MMMMMMMFRQQQTEEAKQLYTYIAVLVLVHWLGGVVVRSRTSDSEVAGSSPTRTAVE